VSTTDREAAAGRSRPDDWDLGGEIVLGSALFTLVEPHRGHEVAYNRWYERDHFYAGCMNGPFYFAGRRWVCTRPLKDMRPGAPAGEAPLFGDDRAGSYLALYWTPKGRFRDNTDWSTRQVHWLHANGRMFAERDHIHTLLYLYRGAVARDADGVPPELALDHPFPGLAAVVVEPAGAEDPAAEPPAVPRPELTDASPVALVLSFRGVPLPPDAPVTQPGTDGAEHRELQLWFADTEPATWWDRVGAYADGLAESGAGRVRWASPFIPTIPGTDTYTDQLW
jgi:hypothetical protein